MKKGTILLLLALLLALPLAAQADITIDPQVAVVNGRVTVAWTDSENNGPYMVGYQYYDESSSAVQTAFWAGGDQASSTTEKKQFTFDYLLPGHQYLVDVFTENGDEDSAVITVPAAEEFVDGKLKASSVRTSVDYRYMKVGGDSIGSLDQLKASDMVQHIEDRYYGMRYEITLPVLAYARDYFVQIAMYAPNGYCETVHTSQYEFSTGVGFTHYLRLMGVDFFADMYDKNGDIPVGDYTIELYFNGMLANTRTFKVRQ